MGVRSVTLLALLNLDSGVPVLCVDNYFVVLPRGTHKSATFVADYSGGDTVRLELYLEKRSIFLAGKTVKTNVAF
jgi:hypothetical protein